ncbi:hypothetical protein Thi970DRAFT_03797 [Thiorhodovibrio frisius]|uniref:Uncharacterized protein n=1 Tax=Thiorhodovibrio frisius TaxID=631362 RepID=H8Z4B8_9GAMM|nr:hypothetical protein Thi970DRAFT_03797 [Thiorhodovibrio frisius]WPL20912.1 hypothetical protein Thiofri_01018 [Thiorhodovibrio frisius]
MLVMLCYFNYSPEPLIHQQARCQRSLDSSLSHQNGRPANSSNETNVKVSTVAPALAYLRC